MRLREDRTLAAFICAIIIATAVTSFLAYFILKRLGIRNKSLIVKISVMNILFCAAFPLLFALFSGAADKSGGMPARGLPPVFIALAILTFLYIAFIIWGVALRSHAFLLNIPVPAPEPTETGAGMREIPDNFTGVGGGPDGGEDITPKMVKMTQENAENIANMSLYEKDTVDTVVNIDKMSIITALPRDTDVNDINSLVNRAFDSLGGGKPDEAAEYFYSAIEKHPPLNLEIQIAIQLCMVYLELGQAELAFDILVGYNDQYRNRLSEEDKSILETGISMIESMVTGIGGDGYEKD